MIEPEKYQYLRKNKYNIGANNRNKREIFIQKIIDSIRLIAYDIRKKCLAHLPKLKIGEIPLPTLKDVAEHVGVSISTVSRVINNDTSRSVSVETKQKIWRAVQELGYEPNLYARQLVTGKTEGLRATKQIGCIVSMTKNKYNHPYFSPILEGIEKELTEHGYHLAYIHTLDEIAHEGMLHRIVQEEQIDGMIIVEEIAEEIYQYLKRNVPVLVGIDLSDPSIPTVTYNRIAAAKMAVKHLIGQGHREIGYIGGGGLTGDAMQERRFLGYKEALEEAGLEYNSEWVISANWEVERSYRGMSELLAKYPNKRPTAIFAASDMMGIAAIRAVTEQGLRIPEDIAFVGLDNIDIAQYTSPPLSSIHIPKFEMGMIAARTLVDYLEGRYTFPVKIVTPFELKIRQSSQSKGKER